MIIINKRSTILGTSINGAIVSLLPGVNDVNPDHWATLEKSPLISTMVDEGELVVHEAGASAAATVADLSGHDAKDAVALVRQTFDLKLLDKWSENEERTTVLKAIEKQQEAIDKAADAKAGEEPEADDTTEV